MLNVEIMTAFWNIELTFVVLYIYYMKVLRLCMFDLVMNLWLEGQSFDVKVWILTLDR